MGGWPMRDLEGYIKWRSSVVNCCEWCGAEDVELRQDGSDLSYTTTCAECYNPPEGPAPGTGGLDYPFFDDLPIVEHAPEDRR